MMTRQRCGVLAWTIAVAALGMGLRGAPASGYAEWQTFKDDDGTMKSYWGLCEPGQVLRKIFVLEKIAGAQDALVQYQMGANPYHYGTKTSYDKPRQGVTWNEVQIVVNGTVAARGSPLELAIEGWHKVRVDPKLLKLGENHVDFCWVGGGKEEGSGVFYLGIDTATHKNRSSSSVNGVEFTFKNLRPDEPPSPQWQGEYMVRLQIAFPGTVAGAAGPAAWKEVFSDDFNRVDIIGEDWVIQSGKWDIRGELKGNGPDALLMCTRRFQIPFRIEYDCSSDNPCDLTLQFKEKLADKSPVCFVGFGSELNTKNKIATSAQGDVAVSKENLIEPGRRHHVTVEVTETTVKQKIDGKDSVSADIALSKKSKKSLYLGLYTWNSGAFGNAKVYSPYATETGKEESPLIPAQPQASVREFTSFEDWPVGAIAGTKCTVACGEKCSVKIADVPTWLYYDVKQEFRAYKENEDPAKAGAMMKMSPNKGPHWFSDHCVELASEDAQAKGKAQIAFPAPTMQNGLVEFDLMADHYTGDALRVRLADNLGLFIDKDGTFFWEAGGKTIRLADKIKYPSLGGSGRFYLWPQRWFTLRIDYDTSRSLANVTIVNLYNSVSTYGVRATSGISQYFPIGEDLPLPADGVSKLTFETAGVGRFYVDNLFFISRTADLADDAKWQVAARDIMKAYYHLRKDPLNLKTYSLRDVRSSGGGWIPGNEMADDKQFLGCAEKYNRLLFEQAFLAEKMRGLERAYFYLSAASNAQAGEFGGPMALARKSVAETDELLAGLYRFYADCYLDSDQEKVKEGFPARMDALKAAIAKSDALLEATYREMISKTSGKPGQIACRYEERPDVASLTFSDGSHRLNGRREFLFVGVSQMFWPYMQRDLLLSNILKDEDQALAEGAKEPLYCDPSTGNGFHRAFASDPSGLVIFRLGSGEHCQESTLPAWWVAKHKSDPDIYLRNYKGESSFGGDASFQGFNFWNPEVLAAQKAFLQGTIDVIAGYNPQWPRRIACIDMAAEALMQIPAPGGFWETGYNKTAVLAFREYLKKRYGDIATLNGKWSSHYAGFDAITPPDDFRQNPRLVPTGLGFEFERWRTKSWADWLKQCHTWIQEKLPQPTPKSCDISYPIFQCQDSVEGIESVTMFDAFDIVMEHYQLRFAEDPTVYRYLENLRQAFHSSTGIGEWYPGGPGEVFDEQAVLNDSLRQTFQLVQWGRSELMYWGGHWNNFLENGNWTEWRLGNTVFRYHAAYIPLGIARARAHQAIYLECPLVEPYVGVVESETSFYNNTGVRGDVGGFAGLLSSKGHDFGFLFERLIMDGRQKLDNYKVLILPSALSLPADFTQKLMAWVEKGGVLIATGPVGVWNEYGQSNGLILDAVIGKGNWSNEGRRFRLKDNLADTATCKIPYRQAMSFLVEGRRGNGKIYIRQGSVPTETIYGLISSSAPRSFYGEGKKFHLVMRQGQNEKALYLSILNPDCYQTLEDDIVLRGEYKDVADISCSFPVAATVRDGMTRFRVKLAPAEGTMVRISQ